MSPRVRLALRLVLAVFFGFVVSVGVNFAICHFGEDDICRDLMWPAAVVLGTGFEGQLFAWAGITLAMAVLWSVGFYFLLRKAGPVKRQ
jgi:hypothetical protein